MDTWNPPSKIILHLVYLATKQSCLFTLFCFIKPYSFKVGYKNVQNTKHSCIKTGGMHHFVTAESCATNILITLSREDKSDSLLFVCWSSAALRGSLGCVKWKCSRRWGGGYKRVAAHRWVEPREEGWGINQKAADTVKRFKLFTPSSLLL